MHRKSGVLGLTVQGS